MVGDTNSAARLLEDEEILWVLGEYGGAALNASIHACEFIVAKLSRLSDESIGPMRNSFSQRAEGYRKLGADLRRRLSITDMVPFAGGISVSDIQTREKNPDRDPPAFSRNMFTFPENQVGPGEGGPDGGESGLA
jgi:hypothetical protein